MRRAVGKSLKGILVLFMALLMTVSLVAGPVGAANKVVDLSIDADPFTAGIQNTVLVPTPGVGVHFFVDVMVEGNAQQTNAVAAYILFDKAKLAAGTGANDETILTGSEQFSTVSRAISTTLAGGAIADGNDMGGNTYVIQAGNRLGAGTAFHALVSGTVVTGNLVLDDIAGAIIEFRTGSVAAGATTLAGANIVAGTNLKGNKYTIQAGDKLGLGMTFVARILAANASGTDFILTNLAGASIAFFDALENPALMLLTVDTDGNTVPGGLPAGKGMVKFTQSASNDQALDLPSGTFPVARIEFMTKAQIGAGGTLIEFSVTDPIKTNSAYGAGESVLDQTNSATINQDPGVGYVIDQITTPIVAGVPSDMRVTAVTLSTGATKTDYVGTVHFTSTDPNPTLPGDYAFQAGDLGVKTFTVVDGVGGVTFRTAGTRTVTGTDTVNNAVTGTSGNIIVNAADAANLRVTGTAAVNAGANNQLTITAYDAFGNVATGYTGDKSLTFSGPLASAGGNTPTVTDKTAVATNVGTATTITFTSGVSSAGGILVAYKAEVTTVDVSDGTINSTGNAAWDLDLTVNPVNAANLRVTGTAAVNAGANNQLTITAYDQYGNVATGYTGDKNLTFSGPLASAGANTPTVTDKTGAAVNVGTATTVTFTSGVSTAGGILRAYKVEVTTVDVTDGTIDSTGNAAWDLDLTVTADTAANLRVTGTAAATAGANNQLTVTAYDAFGNVATGYTGDKSLTFSGPLASADGNTPTVTDKTAAAVNVGTATTITFANGVSTVGGILKAYKVEVTTVDVTDGAINSTGNLTWDLDLTVNPANAGNLRVTGTAAVNAGANNQLTITAYDAYGNVATAYTGDKSLTFSGPLTSAGGNTPTVTDKTAVATNVGTATTITFTSGVSTAGGILVAYKAEVTTVDVTDSTLDSSGNAAWDLDLTVNPVNAANLRVTGGAAQVAGANNQLTITAYDQYGNVATGYTGDKSLTFSGPLASAGANTPTVTDKTGAATNVGTATTITFTSGVSTAGGILVAYKVEVTTVDVTDSAIDSTGNAAWDLDLTVTAANAANLRVTGTAAVTAGANNQLTVTAYDAFGNVATGYTGDKSLTFSGPLASAGGNTPTVTSKTAAAVDVGTATTITFTNGVSTAGGILKAYKVEVTTVDVTDGAVDSTGNVAWDLDLTVTADTAANLRVTGTAAVNAGANNQLTITAYDQYGNVATGYTGDKSLTFSGPLASAGGNTPTVTDNTGAATNVGTATTITFTSGVSTAGGILKAYKAEATTVDVTDGTINSTGNVAWDLDLTVSPLAAVALTVSGIDDPIVKNNASSVTVTAKDLYGNVATGYVGTVTFSTSDGDVGVVLPGNYAFQASDNGTKTFAGGVKLQTVGEQTVTATDIGNGTITGTLSGITVVTITFTVDQITTPITAGVPSNVRVTAKEGLATKTDYAGTITFTSTDVNAVLPANYAFQAGDLGVKTFTVVGGVGGVTFKTSGTQTVTASQVAAPAITGTSANITVNADTAANLRVTGTAAVNAGANNQLTITAYDQFGNVATTYTGDKSLTFSGPAASAGGNTPTVTNKTGTATNVGTSTTITFTNGVSSAGGILVAYKVEVTTVDVTDGTINSTGNVAWDLDLTVNPANAGNLRVTGTAAVSAGANNQLTITAYDAYGNVATGYTGDKSLTFSGPAASAGGNTPTVTSKTAVATNVGTATTITFTSGVSTAGGILVAYKAEGTTVDVTDGTIDSTGNVAWDLDLTVSPLAAANLRVTGTAVMTAGTNNQLTITAYDQYGNVATGYTGDKSLTFSGPAASAGGSTPTVTSKIGATVDVGTATTITFTSGVSSAGGILKAYKAEVTTVDVSDLTIDSTGNAAWDLDLTVNHAAAANFLVAGITDPATKNVAYSVTVTARDIFGNTATTYTGIIKFTSTDVGAGVVLPANYTFTSGVGMDNGIKTFAGGVKLQTYGEQSVTVTDTNPLNPITGSQTAITVVPVITVSYNLGLGWNLFSTPFSLEDGYRSWGELGVLKPSLATNAVIAYYYDPDYTVSGVPMPWRQVTSTYDLYPGDAIYVNMGVADTVDLVANSLPGIPSKSLKTGFNLVGLGYYAAGATGMAVDNALISIYTVGSNFNGYAQVISPALNQTGFIYLRGNPGGGAIPDMKIAKGYWVFMTNPGILGGFTATPLP